MDLVFDQNHMRFNYRVAGVWIVNDHVLLHKNELDEHWSLPGGRVEWMEASHVALKREFMEELQIDIRVDQILWTSENFFDYQGILFHEIGFYYSVSGRGAEHFSTQPFYGVEEDRRLIYQWLPIQELGEISLQPAFLCKGIQGLPSDPVHLVIREDSSAGKKLKNQLLWRCVWMSILWLVVIGPLSTLLHEVGHGLGALRSTNHPIHIYVGRYSEKNCENIRLGRLHFHLEWSYAVGYTHWGTADDGFGRRSTHVFKYIHLFYFVGLLDSRGISE